MATRNYQSPVGMPRAGSRSARRAELTAGGLAERWVLEEVEPGCRFDYPLPDGIKLPPETPMSYSRWTGQP